MKINFCLKKLSLIKLARVVPIPLIFTISFCSTYWVSKLLNLLK